MAIADVHGRIGQGIHAGSSTLSKKDSFDLLDYYYVKHVPKYYVADFKLKAVRKFKNKKEADRYVAKASERDKNKKKPTAKVIERFEKEVWVCFVTGGMDKFLGAGPAWSYPNWKSWPFFGYYAYKSGAPLDETDREYLIQGITRKVKDHQREKNKRRTQELRHLNQSANSGWQGEEDAFVDQPKWENFGATPGVILKHKKGAIPPQKIMPTPLSQGHAQLAEEHAKDTRDALGIEREALALQSDQSSGRAIALRQKQSMVMLQGFFDNLARTRRSIGRFILSILPELYDVESAMRTLGEAFLMQNFVMVVPDPMTGQPVQQFNQQAAMQTIAKVLGDAEFGRFDVAVGRP